MRRAQPLKAGVQAAQRWGRISAGFVGGRNIGQVVRKTDDLWCSTAGAVLGGAAAASSLAEVPQSIATFVGFSLFMDLAFSGRQQQPTDSEGGDKIEWRGRSVADIRAEAEARARADYEKRHDGDSTRLRALK